MANWRQPKPRKVQHRYSSRNKERGQQIPPSQHEIAITTTSSHTNAPSQSESSHKSSPQRLTDTQRALFETYGHTVVSFDDPNRFPTAGEFKTVFEQIEDGS